MKLRLLPLVLLAVVVGCSTGGPSAPSDAPDAAASALASLVVHATGHPTLRGIVNPRERAARICAVQSHPGPGFKLTMHGDQARFHALGFGLEGGPAVTARAQQENRVELRRGPGLTEWYQRGPLGLEQGFNVKKGGAEIALHVAVTGATPVQAGDDEIALVEGTRIAARYGEAYATDATGRRLGVKLVAEEAGIEIRVATDNAVFPVAIDPLVWSQQAKLVANDGAQGDWFGVAVGLSGNTALVGAYQKSSGAAYVFVRSGTTWTQQQELTASGSSELGYSAALSGDTALLGSVGDNSSVGAAYVFVRSGTTWTQQKKLTASSTVLFGASVAVASNTALVGSTGTNSNTGAVYVFVRSGTTWTQQQELTASDGATNDRLGSSAALSGDTAVSGAPYNNSNTGAAYVFVRSGTTWTQQQKLTASDGAAKDYFGRVALDGDTAIVGAPSKGPGAAYVFVRSGTTWTQQKKLTASDGAAGDQFGVSLALSGDTAFVGARGNNSYAGAAYVFVRSGTTWTQQKKLLANDAAASDQFGYSAALSGSTALVGAARKASDTGAAYVFTLLATNGSTCPTGGPIGCISGKCADGVCCGTTCNQPCQTCSATPGTCTAVKSANDPDTCTGTNTCNANGACKKKLGQTCSAASDCASGFCADGFCCNSACNGACNRCDGATLGWANGTDGTCAIAPAGYAGAPSCGAYACGGSSSACATSCTSDKTCGTGYYCNANGNCLAQKAQGATCSSSADCKTAGCRVCATGNCVDSVCCDTACNGTCQACSGAKKGSGADGTCGNIADGTDPDSECTPNTCHAGVCAASCTTNADCAKGTVCVAGGCITPAADGATCQSNLECQNGNCVDGYCCNTTCTGQCEACDVAGNLGTCSPVTGQPHGTTRTQCNGDGSKCSGSCNGTDRTQCQYLAAGKPCGSDSCSNGSAQTSTCDGQGTCAAEKAQPCSPYVCGADACLATCTKDTDCATGYECKSGACTPASGAHCSTDGNSSIKADGTVTPCMAYTCDQSSGACNKVCSNGSTDCATGYACDPTSKTCIETSTGSGSSNSSGGCGCRAAGGSRESGAPWLLLLGLGLLVARRRDAQSGAE